MEADGVTESAVIAPTATVGNDKLWAKRVEHYDGRFLERDAVYCD